MDRFVKYASIILDVSIDKMLDYGIAAHQLDLVKRGSRVEVPLRGRPAGGYVFAVKEQCDFAKVLPISHVSPQELITDELFELAIWMAKYYCSPLRQVLKIILPASVRKGTSPKVQLFVMRGKTKEEICAFCEKFRIQYPAQLPFWM